MDTNATYLNLMGHVELDKYKSVYFLLSFTVYLLIICCNALIILVICTNKQLHEPMYIFVAALLLNAVFGVTAFYPKVLTDFLSDRQIISYEACVFQAFSLYTYAMSEFMLLAAMAYDRYVSICNPLQYNTVIKMSTVKKLIFLCWFLPCCENTMGIILIYRLKRCEFKLNRIYCSYFAIVKLSCGDISVNNLYGLFLLVIAVFPSLFFVFFSYVKILSVCLRNSREFRRKALQTCLPHLLIFTCFTVTSCFEIINSRLEGNIPHIITMIMSVENVVIPPLINPIIYGLKLKEIYNRIKRVLWKRRRQIYF